MKEIIKGAKEFNLILVTILPHLIIKLNNYL
jgi:hypothetical protein